MRVEELTGPWWWWWFSGRSAYSPSTPTCGETIHHWDKYGKRQFSMEWFRYTCDERPVTVHMWACIIFD